MPIPSACLSCASGRAAESAVLPARLAPAIGVEDVSAIDDVTLCHHLGQLGWVGVAELGPLGK